MPWEAEPWELHYWALLPDSNGNLTSGSSQQETEARKRVRTEYVFPVSSPSMKVGCLPLLQVTIPVGGPLLTATLSEFSTAAPLLLPSGLGDPMSLCCCPRILQYPSLTSPNPSHTFVNIFLIKLSTNTKFEYAIYFLPEPWLIQETFTTLWWKIFANLCQFHLTNIDWLPTVCQVLFFSLGL